MAEKAEKKWKYLVVNVAYRDSSQQVVDFVSANYRLVFSYILKEELDIYLDELYKDGWQLIRIQSQKDGKDEAYYFKLPLV